MPENEATADTGKGGKGEFKKEAALVLSGGAPNSPLMGGALASIYEAGKTFDVLYTSGAGALVGLLYIAPNGIEAPQALEVLVESSISDEIYKVLPLGYKSFFKPGPFTAPVFEFANKYLRQTGATSEKGKSRQRLYNDLVDLWAAAVTPTNVNFFSSGLCQPYPFLEEIVDFDKVQKFNGDFYMNAYCVDDQEMCNFHGSEVDARHFYAALSYPFIYQPTEIDGKLYYEGADHDPINFKGLLERVKGRHIGMETVVLMDVLDTLKECLIRKPRHLLDAYGISIMTPVVALAEKDCEHFQDQLDHHFDDHFEDHMEAGVHRTEKVDFIRMKFEIPYSKKPYITDWSRSNMTLMWELGRKTGEEWVKENGSLLPDREEGSASPVNKA